MIDESAAVLPLWMLISATFGFMIGEALGGQARVRKYLEQANDDLRDQIQEAHPGARTCSVSSVNSAESLMTSTSESLL